MAYEIRHKGEAEYHLLQFHGDADLLADLHRTLRITDGITRFRIIKPALGTPDPLDQARRRPGRDGDADAASDSRSRAGLPRGGAAAVPDGPAPAAQQISAGSGLNLGKAGPRSKTRPNSAEAIRSLPKGAATVAATNINRVIITGNLTSDPELRSLPSGTSVCKLRVACNTRRKDNSTGEWVDKPNYFDVTRLGGAGRELRALPPRAALSRSTVASSGASGSRPRARSARRSTSSPTRCSSSAGGRRLRRRQRVHAAIRHPRRHERLRRRAQRGRRNLLVVGRRRRHPVLGRTPAGLRGPMRITGLRHAEARSCASCHTMEAFWRRPARRVRAPAGGARPVSSSTMYSLKRGSPHRGEAAQP